MKSFKTQTSAQKLLSNRVRTAGRFSLRALFSSRERRLVAVFLLVMGQFFYPVNADFDAVALALSVVCFLCAFLVFVDMAIAFYQSLSRRKGAGV
jgi:hypothetical protein